jgi:hypothetical protein
MEYARALRLLGWYEAAQVPASPGAEAAAIADH